MGEVTGELRKLRRNKLADLLVSIDIFRMIKLKRVKWAKHLIFGISKRNAHIVFISKLRARDNLENTKLEIILK